MDDLSIAAQSDGDGVMRLHLTGELDMANAPQLTTAAWCATDRAREVLLDLAALRFMDSGGIHALLTAQRHAADRGVLLRIVNAHGHPGRVLDLTGLRSILEGAEPLP